MKEYGAGIDIRGMQRGRLDVAIELLLVALFVFMPFALGARSAWSEEVVIALSGAIVICFLLKRLFGGGEDLVWTWAYVPVGFFVLIAVFQLIPLPAELASTISPNTVTLRQELLGDLPGAEALLKSVPLTFYPNATRHDLRLVLSVAAVFVVAVSFFRRPDQIKRILMTVALVGGIVAAVALAQDLFGNGKIYWFISGPRSRTLSGPFVNRNHYGQFMNLSIGAALAWICVTLHERFVARKVTPSVVYDYLSSDAARPLWLLVSIMALGTATIFASLTRGGMISMLFASAVITLVLVSRPSLKGRGWIMVIMALGAFACILYVGFDAVYDRFATLGDSQAYGSRLQILKDLTVSFRQFPALGTGLGTHAVVYPMLKNICSTLLFRHAENEYAQVMEEMGLVGLITLMIFAAIILSSFVKNIRHAELPIRSAAYGLGFGLLAVLVHSVSDYGQHVPANAFISAIFCALLLSLAKQGKTRHHKQAVFSIHSFRALYVVALMAACGVWTWALIGADNARVAESIWAKTLDTEKAIAENDWQASDGEYADLISGAEEALEHQPDNVRYRYRHAVYRWHSISQVKDPETGIAVIHADLIPAVRDIVSEFHEVCAVCPTFGPPYSVAGQVEKFVLNEPGGAAKIRRGFRLAPSDPAACFVAGRLDVLEGKAEHCIAKFEKAVQLDRGLFKDVVDIYIHQLSRPHLAISAAGDHVGQLSHVANVLDDMQYGDLAEQVRHRIRSLLEAKCAEPDASASVFAHLGSIYGSEGNNGTAAECYRQALAQQYGEVHWRLQLATLLVRMGRMQEAMDEAKICLQLRPQYKAAEALIADLSLRPAFLAEQAKSP